MYLGWSCAPRRSPTRASFFQQEPHQIRKKNITENEDGFQYGRRFYWHHSCRPSRRPSPHPAVKTHHEILHIEIEKQKKYQNYFREISNQKIKVFKKKISR